MGKNKYTHCVVVGTEDGPSYLSERNGVLYSYSESGKRFSRAKAIEKRDEYIAANPGKGVSYGITVVYMHPRTRGKHRAMVREREASERAEWLWLAE